MKQRNAMVEGVAILVGETLIVENQKKEVDQKKNQQ